MRKDFFADVETMGCWDGQTASIVLSRKTLKNVADYSGTLIHELIHAQSGFDDVTREFERSLTETIGQLCEIALNNNKQRSWNPFRNIGR